MLSTSLEKNLPVKLAKALSNPLFLALDSQLRSGRHISIEQLDNYAFLMDFQEEREGFCLRYNVELLRAPEGFFYLRPCATTLIPRSVLSALDMIVGKILCYLYLSPERLAHEGIFSQQELNDELLSLGDENKLLKLVNQRSTGSDLDRQKLQEKVCASLHRLRRLGMVWFMGNAARKFRITESVFLFGDDPREAQLRMIRDGEAMPLEKALSLGDDQDENDENEAVAGESADGPEDEQAWLNAANSAH